MFTGLIEAMGEVVEVKPTPSGFRLRLTTAIASELAPGESLSVNGVCLTVVAADSDGDAERTDLAGEGLRIELSS